MAQLAPSNVTALTSAAKTRLEERARTASEIEVLGSETKGFDPAIGTLLTRLADAVRRGDRDEIHGYADAVDPRAIAEVLTSKRSWIWGIFEVARNVLVFAPIAVTWFGLSRATDAYATELAAKPDLASKPFLLLWEQGFGGAPGVITFSTVAIPPMVMTSCCPLAPSMGMLFLGTGIPMSPISPSPVCPMVM